MPGSSANRGPFRFINALTEDERFLQIVQQLWNTSLTGTSMYKLWRKLQLCKVPLKELRNKYIGCLERNIDQAKENLNDIQKIITKSIKPDLIEQESKAYQAGAAEMALQEKIYKQKSKAHWIEVGDGNNSYFFKCMKARSSTNTIFMLKNETGTMLHKSHEIEIEVRTFYKQLLGIAATRLPVIDVPSMRRGTRLNSHQK
ncbi:hypothetical protein FXO38_26356 [Capsicum annuum]|uniref:Uncharacterized protein n=1 Tax=Capsicum annuum TaxID=4072 RepID=A0A2G3AN76_CAPAN|nr:hypothetical protein FXO38_26356 [Capsicum annuum]PHT95670.1 hypothetical protein T459_03552 [Capsicum annuum]